MGSCAAPSAKGDDKFITTDYLQQCLIKRQFGFNDQIQGAAEKTITNWRCYSPQPNLFRVDQMIRQWERSQ
jgi:hypothetical protein